jgi:hypothetical protein
MGLLESVCIAFGVVFLAYCIGTLVEYVLRDYGCGLEAPSCSGLSDNIVGSAGSGIDSDLIPPSYQVLFDFGPFEEEIKDAEDLPGKD